ncbi:metallo ase inhibitor 3-like protein [Labeo rohita]|uniref:Metallo ase inhibitor 3-like protein n=1 Tax=Labeo rohita TaxID=84645 RepID=A0A498NJU1_LABRO|nr:metallo ase inhibitor 3-like protein [Labeo rohita]
MGVPLSAAVTLGLMFFLSVGLNEQVAKGCSCAAEHPQQLFCNSDIVIRAKITGKVTNTLPDLTAYGVRIIKTFKNVNKKPFQVIYSHNACGISPGKDEYLLSDFALYWSVLFDQNPSTKVSDESQKCIRY